MGFDLVSHTSFGYNLIYKTYFYCMVFGRVAECLHFKVGDEQSALGALDQYHLTAVAIYSNLCPLGGPALSRWEL